MTSTMLCAVNISRPGDCLACCLASLALLYTVLKVWLREAGTKADVVLYEHVNDLGRALVPAQNN